MIDPISISLFLGSIIVGGLIIVYWDNIVIWCKELFQRLPESIKRYVKGIEAFVVAAKEGFFNAIKSYSYKPETKQWTETTNTREVDPCEIPEHIRNKLRNDSVVDITDELVEKLKLSS
jgi:hypothetical protein